MLSNLIYFLIACSFLAGSAIILVKLLKKLAIILGITDFAAAFIIMAAATSLPELFVGITSAIAKTPSLSFGNILGADILDISLLLGVMIIAAGGIKTKEKGMKRDSIIMIIAVSLLPILYLIGNSISRIDGFILLSFYLTYTGFIIKTRKIEKTKKQQKPGIIDSILTILLFIGCLGVLFLSSNSVVKYSTLLSSDLNLPPIVIGLFLISFGTTLPELSFGVSAALMKHGEMAIGDQVGTVIFNSTFIVGVTALIHPITTAFMPFFIASFFLLFLSLVYSRFISSSNNLTKKEGWILIGLYLIFLTIQFYPK
jgi:cation:H+ antiporter